MSEEKRESDKYTSPTRQANCRLLSMNFMQRNIVGIDTAADGAIERNYAAGSLRNLYMDGYSEGFSMAVELILSGALKLNEIEIDQPGPDSGTG